MSAPTLITLDVLPGSVVIDPERMKEIEGVLYDMPLRYSAVLINILSECEEVGKP